MPKQNSFPYEKKAFYISKDLHKRLLMYCLSHDIKYMNVWAEEILEAAIRKPSAKERIEKQLAEMPPEMRDEVENEDKNPPAEISSDTVIPASGDGLIKVVD